MTITACSEKQGLTLFKNIPSYHYFKCEFEPSWDPILINDLIILAWCDNCQHPITSKQPYLHLGEEIYLCQTCSNEQ